MRACSPNFVRKAGYVAAFVAGTIAVGQSSGVKVAEAGSTLIYPPFKVWKDADAKVDPSVHMTAGATESGAGIAEAIARQAQNK